MNEQQKNELIGYDTLNSKIYKFSNVFLLIMLVSLIIFILLTGLNALFFPQQIIVTIAGIIASILLLTTFLAVFLITSSSLKKNDLIVIRKYRAGAGLISKINIQRKSEILFDPKDATSKVTISWAGAITDVLSGCKIIQITEGNHINDNLNSQVSESEWDKDVARLTKAKSVADLAEAELFAQGLFGLKWQDIVLIVIGLICLGIFGYLVMGAPDAIAKKTIEGLMNGTIQNAIAGIVIPTPIK